MKYVFYGLMTIAIILNLIGMVGTMWSVEFYGDYDNGFGKFLVFGVTVGALALVIAYIGHAVDKLKK